MISCRALSIIIRLCKLGFGWRGSKINIWVIKNISKNNFSWILNLSFRNTHINILNNSLENFFLQRVICSFSFNKFSFCFKNRSLIRLWRVCCTKRWNGLEIKFKFKVNTVNLKIFFRIIFKMINLRIINNEIFFIKNFFLKKNN